MSLYISQGSGSGVKIVAWSPGDPGIPNRADSKEELQAHCPLPEPLPCRNAECNNMGVTGVGRPTKGHRFFCWNRHAECYRCYGLYNRHKLRLIELIALWEAQDRRCYHCSRMLADPRLGEIKGESLRVDHDHNICPQAHHSCKRCRRGLACKSCNVNQLAIRTAGWCVLPQGDSLAGWLEFLGPADRDRLRAGLTLFPEQPVRRVPRRRSEHVPGEGTVASLFDLDAYRPA